MNAFDARQPLAIECVDFLAACTHPGHMLELQQAKGCVDLAHLAIDSRRDHGHFVGNAEILQVIDALLGLGVGTDYGAAFERIEDLGRMKT